MHIIECKDQVLSQLENLQENASAKAETNSHSELKKFRNSSVPHQEPKNTRSVAKLQIQQIKYKYM